MQWKTTDDVKVSKLLNEQVIGQEVALELVRKASKQRRNVLLIGEPGTGKSLLGQALAELLHTEKLVDILSFPNPTDENIPLVRTVPKGEGKSLVNNQRLAAASAFRTQNIVIFIVIIVISLIPYYFWKTGAISDVVYAASMISSMVFIVGFLLFLNLGKRMKMNEATNVPKLLVDNSDKKNAPFIDATGAHTGALLGDVLHDPLQSGGLGTPPYERLLAGMIHRANGGVLFIDEIASLSYRSQQELLTALQEKKYPITGQSERSSGAQTRSEPVPCDFILVAAGNVDSLEKMHPALRSRIRGYGYEVYMNTTMDDTPENRKKMWQFVAQEVRKDKKIPAFEKTGVDAIIEESKRMAGMSGKLTLRLRELGGLIRAAGDLAIERNLKLVTAKEVDDAKALARTLEQQMADRYIENKKKYEMIITKGNIVGRVNGLAVIGHGSALSGIILPIESEVVQGGKKAEFIATGKLGEIAKEAIKNVSAIILKSFGEDLKERYDVFIQFLQTYEGVEGDSASIAVATAIMSALKKVPIKQEVAMTGSLSVRGEVLAIGGVSAKIEAAIDAGLTTVIIPKSNEQDIVIKPERLKKIKVIPVTNIKEVLKHALDWKGHESVLKQIEKNL